MPLPVHVLSKLLAEFSSVPNDSISIRIALPIAAVYAGIVGLRIEWPWDIIVKIQWILKTVELGSYAVLYPMSTDQITLDIPEAYGPRVFDFPRPILQTLVVG